VRERKIVAKMMLFFNPTHNNNIIKDVFDKK
jgi:hypothetical protein